MPAHPAPDRQSVLVVEDNPVTRKLVRVALEAEGYRVLEARDGGRAVALLAAEAPDLVIQDLVLPDMDGLALIERLRATGRGAEIPILAFSGLIQQLEDQRLARAGFDDLMLKPIEPSRLVDVVRAHLPQPVAPSRLPGAGRHVVLADDDPVQRKLTRVRLEQLGFAVTTAADGAEALELARRLRPDVLVSDVLMPRLDGFGLCLEARQDPRLSDLPIVLVTSSYIEAEDRALAEQAGADAFIVRTPDLRELLQTLEAPLGRVDPRPPPAAAEALALDEQRNRRLLSQLDRHLAVNASLARRASTLAAGLTVLGGVSDAILASRDVHAALADVLARCLDAIGVSRGAIFLVQDARLSVAASHGFEDTPPERLESFFGQPGLLRATILGAQAFELTPSDPAAHPVLEVLAPGATLLPLTCSDERLGALLIDAPPAPVPQRHGDQAWGEDWRSFARSIATQISVALALARTFERMAASEQRRRLLMESAHDAMLVVSAGGLVVEANVAADQLFGLPLDGTEGRRLNDLIPGVGRELYDPAAPSGIHPLVVRRPDGAETPVEATSAHVTLRDEALSLVVLRDVTEREALEAQLRQAQKMEAMGLLAGGVAHDFNNLLAVVLMCSQFLLDDLPADDPRREDVEEILAAGQRGAGLTRQLLAFGRRQVLQPEALVLSEAVAEIGKMLRRLIGEDITLALELAPALPTCLADPGQIEQVLVNLVVNARDAMPGGGRITVTTGLDPQHDDWVVLTVADTGVGMPPEVRARIFEPFYTTKGPGRGTGLGLSTVLGIVEQSGGRVEVDSVPGAGTIFRVLLPRHRGPAPTRAAARPARIRRKGVETVLLAEDDVRLRTGMARVLGAAGYRLLLAADGDEAVEVATRHAGPIPLMVADVVMPGLNGPEAAERVRQLHPETEVLFVSGYFDHTALSAPLLAGGAHFLPKPFTPDALTRKLDELLGARAHTTTG